jgi:hypothetical protein
LTPSTFPLPLLWQAKTLHATQLRAQRKHQEATSLLEMEAAMEVRRGGGGGRWGEERVGELESEMADGLVAEGSFAEGAFG